MPGVQKKCLGAHAAGAGGKLKEERQLNKEEVALTKGAEVALNKGALMPDIFGHDEMSVQTKKNVWVPMLGRVAKCRKHK